LASEAKALDRAAGRDRQAGLDLVEDQQRPLARRELPHGVQVAGLGRGDATVCRDRLHEHARGPVLREGALHRVRVVERHGVNEVARRRRDPLGQPPSRQRRVVVAVIGARNREDVVAAGDGAGEPDGGHRRLGTGVRETPAR
jgi:hypothetical protein